MQIAVLGTGVVGQTLAERFDDLGHEAIIGTRNVDTTMTNAPFAAWAAAHSAVRVGTFAEAAGFGSIVVNATSGSASLAALTAAGTEQLADKVLIDTSNPLDFSQGFPPSLFVKDTDSLAERVQAAFPAARVVKTLNTMTAGLMAHPQQLAGGDHSVFVSGDDAAAKAEVTELLLSMGHTDVIDLGDLSTARGVEMFLPLWLRLMGALGTADFNIKVVRH